MTENTLNDNKARWFGFEEVPPMFGHGGRDWSVDVLRCFSCFMVCVLHAFTMCMLYEIHAEVGSVPYMNTAIYRMIFAAPTVLFVMVSGIFFLSPERNVKTSRVWKKNVLKMTFAYIFWSLMYAFYRISMMDPQPEITADFLYKEWLFEPYHLWYIPMIVWLYILVPIIRPITATRDTKLFKYIVAIFWVALFFNTFLDWPNFPYGEDYIFPLLNKAPIRAISQYPFWMMYGWILYTYRPRKGLLCIIYILGVIAILAGIQSNGFILAHTDDIELFSTSGKFNIFVIMKNTAIFYFIVNTFRNHEFSNIGKKILRKLSTNTFIIYLVHMFFVYYFFDHGFLFDMQDFPWIGPWIYAFIAYFGGAIAAEAFHLVWDPIKAAVFDKKKT